MELISINGVRGYVDEIGTAHLNLEDVSRGLGFTTVATSGNDVIRWSRVNGYLNDMGFSQQVGKDGFIPENIFYRLAMKAKNEVAEKFQTIVADEILPSIRKHGAYMTPKVIEETLTSPDFIIQLATRLKEEQEKAKSLENEVELQRKQLKEQEAPIAIYNLAISASNTMSMADVAKSLGTGRTRLFAFLREHQIIMRKSPTPYQSYIDRGYFKVVERPRASGDKVTNDSVTRVTAKGFDYIAKLLHQKIEA